MTMTQAIDQALNGPEMIEVASSNIRAVGYHPDTMTLRVQFHSGSTWEYHGVQEETYHDLMDAPSIGKAFFALIKGKYDGAKVEEKLEEMVQEAKEGAAVEEMNQ